MSVITHDTARLFFEKRQGFKAAIVAAVIGLVAVGAFVMAVGLVRENPSNWGKSLAVAAVGILLVVWFVYEARAFLFVERYYGDRVQRLRGTTVREEVRFNEPFRFSYSVRADGSERLLTINGRDNAEFLLLAAAGGEPSARQIEELRDHLAEMLARQIAQTIEKSESVSIDRNWTIHADAIEIDGQRVPWVELQLSLDGSSGEVIFQRNGRRMADRSMMSDNVLGAIQFLTARVAVR